MFRTIRRPSNRMWGLAIAPLLIIGLAACAPVNQDGGTSSEEPATQTLVEWQLAYAECMRGEGVDMPDPTAAGTAPLPMGVDAGAMEAANKKCVGELGDPPAMSAEEELAADEQFLAWAREAAKCYREKGYDMPDPTPNEQPQFPEDAPDEVAQECGGMTAATKSNHER